MEVEQVSQAVNLPINDCQGTRSRRDEATSAETRLCCCCCRKGGGLGSPCSPGAYFGEERDSWARAEHLIGASGDGVQRMGSITGFVGWVLGKEPRGCIHRAPGRRGPWSHLRVWMLQL